MNWRTSPKAGRRLDWALLLGDFAVASWLWFSFWRFSGLVDPTFPRVLAPAAASALLGVLLGTHRSNSGARLGALAAAGAALGYGAARLGWLPLSGREALWLGAAQAATAGILHLFHARLGGSLSERAWELVRWTALGLAATLVMLPFYFAGSVGSGDAHWYVVMLADFLAQLKAGAFPVWVGQGPFAFNGAVSPLRYAPGFQYYGGIADFLSAQALQPVAVKNLCLCLSGIGGAFAAYACMRPIVNGRHWIACLLAILWIAGPGVLAPVISGDQYMTFIAIPFVPVVLHGCWRVVALDDRWGRLWIAAGLGALWVCHPPIGLWMTVIAGAIYASMLLLRRSWARELGRIGFMAAVFLAIGSYPFISLLNLDNQLRVTSVGGSAAYEVHRYFPGNFRPISPAGGGLMDYQIGYALLGVLVLSLALLAVSRPRAAWAFALASVLVVPFTVPVPFLTDFLWGHLPGWFVTIDNVWPMQRLFLIWSALAAFTAAVVLGSPRVSGGPWGRALVVAALAAGLAWSATEARKLAALATRTHSSPEQTRVMEGPNNSQLGRYAYGSFATTPGYASHGFMDAWFENRLLDRQSLESFLSNADAAAPGDGPDPGAATLVSKGLMTAENITQSTSYFLRPTLTLDPGKRYALRLEFFDPATDGVLQLMQDTLFREYLLPDSGVGIGRSGPPRSFGTEATSGRVISLGVLGKDPAPIKTILITARASHKDFTAGRYWLYTYERSRLPISVESWIPYRVRFTAPRPAYLESPRMWLKDWRATVNGVAVAPERSPEGLVMVPVPAGPNTVTLDYVPPFAVQASFWIFAGAWVLAGGAALAWLAGAPAPDRARVSAVLAPFRSRTFLLVAAVAVVAAVLYRASGGPMRKDFVRTAGPIEVRFLLPSGAAGTSQPLVATGHAQAGTIVFATLLDARHVRLGADVWGTLYSSEPIEVDYSQVHTLVVSDSALFPKSHPLVEVLSPDELQRLRGELRVELDGKVEIEARCYAYEAGPSEIHVGSSPFGSTTSSRFSGEYIESRRLPIPRLVSMPAGNQARLYLRFPTDRIGSTECLATLKSELGTLSLSATYVGPGRVRIASLGEDGVTRQSAEFDTDLAGAHTMTLYPSEPGDPRQAFDLSCDLDGKHILGGSRPRALPGSPQLSTGTDPFAAKAVQNRFSGPELNLDLVSDMPAAAAPDAFGPVHMILTLPVQRPGRREPILTTGRSGAGDVVYVSYEDSRHIRVGFDHWSYGGKQSDPIPVDYAEPHEIWVLEGALFPSSDGDPRWGATTPEAKSLLRRRVTVVFDGKTVISETVATYPTTREEVTPARNGIGASTADPEFSGIVRYCERTGLFLPPGTTP